MFSKALIVFSMTGFAFCQTAPNQRRFRPLKPIGSITDTSFPGNLAATINGSLPFQPVRFPRFFFGPYVGSFQSYYPYNPPVPPLSVEQVNAPSIVIVPQPVLSVASAPAGDGPVQVYENPVRKDVEDAPPAVATATDEQPIYMLALMDGTVVTAIAYWTDGSQVRYVTSDRKQKQVALSQIDLPLSNRLNRRTGFPIHISPE